MKSREALEQGPLPGGQVAQGNQMLGQRSRLIALPGATPRRAESVRSGRYGQPVDSRGRHDRWLAWPWLKIPLDPAGVPPLAPATISKSGADVACHFTTAEPGRACILLPLLVVMTRHKISKQERRHRADRRDYRLAEDRDRGATAAQARCRGVDKIKFRSTLSLPYRKLSMLGRFDPTYVGRSVALVLRHIGCQPGRAIHDDPTSRDGSAGFADRARAGGEARFPGVWRRLRQEERTG